MTLTQDGWPAVGWMSDDTGTTVCICCCSTEQQAVDALGARPVAIDRFEAESHDAECSLCQRALAEADTVCSP